MKFNTRFNPPKGPQLHRSEKPSKVRQSERDNCDINKIMERFNRTGQLPSVKSIPPQYGNAQAPDYAEALNIIREAKESFNALPVKTRQYFGHDPKNFLQALNDTSDENVKALTKLGLMTPRSESPTETLRKIAKNTEQKSPDPEKSDPEKKARK